MTRSHAKHRAAPVRRHRLSTLTMAMVTAVLASGASSSPADQAAVAPHRSAAVVAMPAAAPSIAVESGRPDAAAEVTAEPTTEPTLSDAEVGEQLVVNGDVALGERGWSAEQADLAVPAGGFARLTPAVTATVTPDDAADAVAAAPAGTTYTVSAQVPATALMVNGQVQVTEVRGDQVLSNARAFQLRDTQWHLVTFTFTTAEPGSALDLSVRAWGLASDQALDVDNLSITVVEPWTQPEPEPDASASKESSRGSSREPTESSTASQAPAEPAPAPLSSAPSSSGRWVLVEDVDLSSSRGWQLEDFRASNTASQDLPGNVSFSGSGLTIVGKRETAPDGSRFSSGDAKGNGHPIPNYARVEVVGRGPSAPGLLPAVLCLRPLGSSDGEIDLMESFGGQPRVKATLHNQHGAGQAMIGGAVPWSALGNSDPNSMHTYVMEKTPNRLKVSVDGVVMVDAGPGDAPAGFDWKRIFENPSQQWYPRVRLQIGCGTANPSCYTGSPSSSFTSTDMRTTSLRVYELAD